MSGSDEIDRALASAQTGDLEQARAILETAKRERTAAMVKARHDMGNALSIAQSSIEAMLDGVADMRPRGLERLLEIIKEVSASLYQVTADAGDPATAISLERLANVKDVHLVLDTARASPEVRFVVMQAIRHAMPGSTVRVEDGPESALVITLRPHSKEACIEAFDGRARQSTGDADAMRVTVRLGPLA